MTVRPKPLNPSRTRRSRIPWLLWLDVMAIAAWGVLLIKYWLTGKINVLLHPDYMWLANSAGIALVVLGLLKGSQLVRQTRGRGDRAPLPNLQHFSLLPRGWSSTLLLAVAVLGLQFTPRPFASAVAMDRGVTETMTMTRSQPQSFRSAARPEDRSVVDWVRTLNVYPEPDAYTGQQVNVEGFVIRPAELPDGFFLISRFIITCCAADVYPVGLPVKLNEGQTMPEVDTWLRVEGRMMTETYGGQRHLTIQPSRLTEISEPDNPYDY